MWEDNVMEPLIHFIVPFIALTLVGVNVKKAFPISLLALLPDFDALFLIHRSLSHSIIVVLAAAMPIVLLTYKFKPRLLNYIILASLAVASHSILDLFAGYTPILWPLSSYSLWIKTELEVHIGSSMFIIPSVKLLTQPTTFQRFQSLDAPLFTGDGLIISLLLSAPLLLKAVEGRAHGAERKDVEAKAV
jgi:membrane-bound metal-dependent hydrolase YbcI (DUF457 family)